MTGGTYFAKRLQASNDPVGRFEINAGFRSASRTSNLRGAASAFHRKKSAEIKPVRGKPRSHERREDRGGAGKHGQRNAFLDTRADESVTRIGNARHAGIRDQRDVRASRHPVNKLGRSCGLVVLVKADEWLFNPQVLQQHPAVSRVLGRNQIRRTKNFNRPQGDILAVSDRCWNNAQHGKCPAYQPSETSAMMLLARSAAALESAWRSMVVRSFPLKKLVLP